MWCSTPSPQSPYSPMPDSELYSPQELHEMQEMEREEREERLAEQNLLRKQKGLSPLREKKDQPYEVARGDLPPQSPVYEYGASESSDEPYSDEERGPAVVDQPPAPVVIAPIAEPNVVIEDISGEGSSDDMDDSDDEDDSDASDSDDADKSDASDASDVTVSPPVASDVSVPVSPPQHP